jgi:hypothetical protein
METNLVTTTVNNPDVNTTAQSTATSAASANVATPIEKNSHKLRNFLIAFFVLFSLAAFGLMSMDDTVMVLNGVEVEGITGFGAAFLACVIACVAVVFAVGITGVVLLGVVVLLAVGAVLVVGSVVLAMLPLLFPALLLIGILMYFSRRKKKMNQTSTMNA